MSDERGVQWSGDHPSAERLLKRWMQWTGEPYDVQRELVRDTKVLLKKKRAKKDDSKLTREDLVRSVIRWSETAMYLQEELRSTEQDLREELQSYKEALDVRLAGDGLIEFKGRYYKRLEEAVDGQL